MRQESPGTSCKEAHRSGAVLEMRITCRIRNVPVILVPGVQGGCMHRGVARGCNGGGIVGGGEHGLGAFKAEGFSSDHY